MSQSASHHPESPLVLYEERLNRDSRWAMIQGSLHFEEKSLVFEAMHNIAKRLDSLGVLYAVIGGMALFKQGYRRYTEGVDILVSNDDFQKVHDHLNGFGYVPNAAKSRHLRDTQNGVKIRFLITDDFPGDGRKKPVSFPHPRDVSFESRGVRYIYLSKLMDLKLASGMTNQHRRRDLADALELIKARCLPLVFREQLDPSVREIYSQLWNEVQQPDPIENQMF